MMQKKVLIINSGALLTEKKKTVLHRTRPCAVVKQNKKINKIQSAMYQGTAGKEVFSKMTICLQYTLLQFADIPECHYSIQHRRRYINMKFKKFV